MNIECEISYAADPVAVSAMTFDREFQSRKCRATGALDFTVDVVASATETVVRTTRDLPTNDFPDFVRSMVGDRLKVSEVDTWGSAGADGSRTGTVVVTVASTPIRFDGTLTLSPAARGATARLRGELKAGVPLFGGKIEQAAAPAVTAAMSAEERTAAQWLAERPV